jgi:hypothetical protein
MADYKKRIRDNHPRLYSQDLLNNLFRHPYTRHRISAGRGRRRSPDGSAISRRTHGCGLPREADLGQAQFLYQQAVGGAVRHRSGGKGVSNEAETCRKWVTPRLQAAGWDNDPHSIAEQRSITDGRVIPVGKGIIRKPPKGVDYLLRYTRAPCCGRGQAAALLSTDRHPAHD